MARKLTILFIAIAVVVAAAMLLFHHRKPVVIAAVKPVVTTRPAAARPSTRRSPATGPSYMDVIRSQNPAVATTQPLAFAVELTDAAHLIVHDPVYLDPSGHLWFTRSDALPTAKALLKPLDDTEHVIRDRPVFVHWWTTDAGDWAAAVVVRKGDGYDIITKSARSHLAGDRPYRWASAFSIIGKIVVPTDVGVSVFDIEPKIAEHYHALPGCTPAGNPPVAIPDTRGILAWAPWEHGRPGSRGVSRFVDGTWTDLPADQWPKRPIQLSILLDGSVLRLAVPVPPSTAPADTDDVVTTTVDPDAALNAMPDHVDISIGQLDPVQLDEKHVNDLIAQLSDDDIDVRQAAFDELSRYGPALSPLLNKAIDQQRPEGQMRIRQLLKNKLTPALGGMMPIDGRLAVARRYADGTVLFFAPAGVQIPTERDEPDVVNPAWITERPDGRMDRPLPPALVRDQKPDAPTLLPVKDEWLVVDDAGPRRFFGNELDPMLAPGELHFSQVVGIALHRRWIFRDPKTGATLIIDPLIADPTPKLPVWTIAVSKGTAGWDGADFPAILHEQGTSSWELGEDGWKQLKPAEKLKTAMQTGDESAPATPTTASTTAPVTAPATAPATRESLGKPILTAEDGTRYFGGKENLIVISPAGVETRWPLPPAAVGAADPVLMQTADKLLFLYNQPGRLLRIKPTPTGPEPFTLEATFTKDIPDSDTHARIWLDPAGRIDWITDGKTLSIMFPAGHIPKPIANMMLEVRP